MGDIEGLVQIYLDGRLVYETRNLFVRAGYNTLGGWLAGLNPAPPGAIAVGTGTAPASATDVALGNEVGRVALSSSVLQAAYLVRLMGTFAAADAQGTLTEAGLFQTATPLAAGLYARTNINVVKGNAQMSVVWQLIVPRG